MNDALIPYQQQSLQQADETTGDSLETLVAAAFSRWEMSGRGWQLYDFPVELEPPFCSFANLLNAPEPPVFDDGRHSTFWSRLAEGVLGKPAADHSSALVLYRQQLMDFQANLVEAFNVRVCPYLDAEFVELQLILPKEMKTAKGAAENLLLSFTYLSCPVSFEIIGTESEIVIQFACSEMDAAHVKSQIKAHLPEVLIKETNNFLFNTWADSDSESLMVDFGLSNEFFLPLKTAFYTDADLFISIIGALSNLKDGEVGIFQILFQKTRETWAQDTVYAVEYLAEIENYPKSAVKSVKDKMASPLFAASVRVASKAGNPQNALHIVKTIGAGLAALSSPNGNELIPLSNDDYPEENSEEALLDRRTFRGGMLLNLEELTALVHTPSSAVRSEKLQREMERTKAAPALALHNPLVLGENFHQGESLEVSLSNDQRTKHIHLIGASGSGKSTLMLNLITQDLEMNQGLCVIDPHGDLIDSVIASIPEHRIKDVVLFDPADAEFPIGFNILQANSELEKTLLSSDLVATFRRMSTSWGDVMDSVLANAILAFVESSKGGTLFDLKRFLVEKDFRNEFLKSVNDDGVRYFWQNEFPLIAGKPQSSILIRLDAFLRQKLIRHIVCQKDNKIDFRKVMDERKILLVKLSQGLIGEENSHLLGTLLVSKLYQTALSRQDSTNRPFFSCYLDEFHHFVTPSMENILSGVRKYNLGLVLAHQEWRQIQSRNAEVASSVLSNCYTRICFRLGDTDAEKFTSGFSFFDAKALQNLSVGEAIGRCERAEYDFNLQIPRLSKVEREVAEQRQTAVIAESRRKYAQAKAEVEAALFRAETKSKDTVIDEVINTENAKTTEGKSEQSSIETAAPKTPVAIVSETTNEHRYLQSIIKRVGENYGFIATLEKQVFGGIGKIDVALESDHLKIACEIAATNTVDYELQNVQKCLASGFDKVVVISTYTKHLTNIRRKAESLITNEHLANVHFLEPENFHLLLEKLQTKSNAPLSDGKIKGYQVNAGFKESKDSDEKTRKQTVFEILSNVIKRKGKK